MLAKLKQQNLFDIDEIEETSDFNLASFRENELENLYRSLPAGIAHVLRKRVETDGLHSPSTEAYVLRLKMGTGGDKVAQAIFSTICRIKQIELIKLSDFIKANTP